MIVLFLYNWAIFFLFQAYFLRLLVFIYVLIAFEASYEMKFA